MTDASARPRRARLLGAAAAALVIASGTVIHAGGVAGAEGPVPAARADNPYEGVTAYVNPEWSARAAAEPGGSAVAGQPTAVWLTSIASITGSAGHMGLRAHLDAALAQDAGLIQLVLYDLPGRACNRRSSFGELAPNEIARYRTEFVDPIAAILADPAYAGLRVVTVIEPNSLPNLVTHVSPRPIATPLCDEMSANGGYLAGVGHALARLGAIGNVYAYLDIGHHGRLGWEENVQPAMDVYLAVANAAGATPAAVHGFTSNVADYAVLRELYFTVDDVVNGRPVREDSPWIDWNDYVDEVPYAVAFRDKLAGAGFDPGIGMVIDTSRNGWGGPDRPTGPGPTTSAAEYVEGGRLDRRGWIGNYCNQTGAGLGERPAVAPEPGIDAYAWLKPPGESDGRGIDSPIEDPLDRMCDPLYEHRETGTPIWTGALPEGPPAGSWFSAHFQQLLRNAHPPLA